MLLHQIELLKTILVALVKVDFYFKINLKVKVSNLMSLPQFVLLKTILVAIVKVDYTFNSI